MKVPIVDEQDNFLYFKDLSERDNLSEIMQITGLWIFNEKGEVLVAKRSKKKEHAPDVWGPSVSGKVEEGETYETNIAKEIEEELGITINNFTKGPKVRVTTSHMFFGQFFFATISSDTEFVLQEMEVDEVKWIKIPELEEWYTKSPKEFVKSFAECLQVLKEYENQD